MHFGAITLVLAISCLLQRNVVSGLLKCRLSFGYYEGYESMEIGQDVPAKAINLGGTKTDSYIATASVNDFGYHIGTYHRSHPNEGYFPFPEVLTDPITSFSVLTNAENCTLKWVSVTTGGPPQFAVQTLYDKANYYVGRYYENGIYHAGQVSYGISSSEITVSIFGENKNISARTGADIQVLTVFSEGIDMRLEGVEIPLEPDTDDANAMSVEEIHNNGNAIISQTVEHRKTIKERFSHTISQTAGTSSVHRCSWNIPIKIIFGIRIGSTSRTYSESHSYSKTTTQTWTTETTTEINLQRTVTVPPYEGVQVCSVVSIRDGIVFNYNGQMVYTAPGLYPEEIREELRKSNPPIEATIDPNTNAVYQNVTGRFEGSVSMSAAFFVVDLRMGMGCVEFAQSQVSAKAQNWRRLKQELQNKAYNNSTM